MADCNNLIANMCGGRGVVMPETSCKSLRLEGVSDVTINQGIGIDLADGVHAYDGDGNEIEVVIDPNEIDKCDVGIHSVKYTAMGKGDSRRPVICGKNALDIGTACDDLTSIEAVRTVTIEQIDPPTISGIEDMEVADGTVFDPMDGVSAVDGNGNSVDVEFEGDYPVAVSGEIVTFDNESSKPARSLKVALEPIQDLNGYDHPWAGGSGANKYDNSIAVDNSRFTATGTGAVNGLSRSDYIEITPNESYYFMGVTPNNSGYSGVFWYDENKAFVRADGASGTTPSTPINLAVTAPSTAKYVGINMFTTNKDNGAVNYPSTVTEWTPYSNICPISGHTEVDAYVTGINVWDEEWEVGGIGAIDGLDDASTTTIRSKNYIPVLPNTSYYVKYPWTGNVRTRFYDADKNYLGYVQKDGTAVYSDSVFVTPDDCHYMRFQTKDGTGTTYNNISINHPSTDHGYHAYEGATYHTDLGQTVYGGTLDVVSGELVVDRAMVTYDGSEAWGLNTSTKPWLFATNAPNDLKQGNAISLYVKKSNIFEPTSNIWDRSGYGMLNNFTSFLVGYPDANGDANVFKSFLSSNPLQVVYELATPQTYTLTAQQVALLMGTNNVWSDAGEVTVVYTKALPQSGSVTLLEGVYYVTYTAEDECGNKTEVTRRIVVGDGNKLCKMRLCEGFADCSQNRTCEAYTCQAYTACE